MLALPQTCDRRRVAGIDQKLKSTDSLQRDDFATQQGFRCFRNRALQLRSTDRAGIRLGMEAAVDGILVLCTALRAEHKVAHRRIRAVVGDIDDDRVAWAAARAVCEGILIAPVARIEEFLATILAGREVRQYVDGFAFLSVAGVNFEAGRTLSRNPGGFVNGNHGSFRAITLESLFEYCELIRRAFHFDYEPGGGIQYPAAQRHLGGETVNKGPKPNTLNRAA
jgi:hypothetical protein